MLSLRKLVRPKICSALLTPAASIHKIIKAGYRCIEEWGERVWIINEHVAQVHDLASLTRGSILTSEMVGRSILSLLSQ